MDDYIRKLLFGKRAKIVLPDFKRFSEEYIMSLDPFPTLAREDMPRDPEFREYYGKINADIIVEGLSATQEIHEEIKRWRTIWNKRYLERKRAERYNNSPPGN